MLKTMNAKYPGRCAISGARIRAGDQITYDTIARKAYLYEPGDPELVGEPEPGRYIGSRGSKYVSHVFNIGGKEYYRNKAGLCEDAPCCGCCTL
jgi:hypothetical protein